MQLINEITLIVRNSVQHWGICLMVYVFNLFIKEQKYNSIVRTIYRLKYKGCSESVVGSQLTFNKLSRIKNTW